MDNSGRCDCRGVPVAVRAEREAGVVAESGLAAGVDLRRSELPVTLGAAVLQGRQAGETNIYFCLTRVV